MLNSGISGNSKLHGKVDGYNESLLDHGFLMDCHSVSFIRYDRFQIIL